MMKLAISTISTISLLLGLLLLFVVSGCGGGNDSEVSGRVAVFMTDVPSDDYSHVWISVQKVELLASNGEVVTVYDNPDGNVIDLKSLRDTLGPRFALLAFADCPNGNYIQARVTVRNRIRLMHTGSANGIEKPLSNPVVTVPLTGSHTVNSDVHDLILDFDLDNFQMDGAEIVQTIRERNEYENEIRNRNRHQQDDFVGTVSRLGGVPPDMNFTLTTGNGSRFTVLIDANSRVYNADDTPNPEVVNGVQVKVEGHLDIATRSFIATEVMIQNTGVGERGLEGVEGAPSDANAAARTFVVTIEDVDNFVPASTTVTIQTTPNTVFRTDGCVLIAEAEFYAAVGSAPEVEVKGEYDEATNTISAVRVKLDNEDDDGFPNGPKYDVGDVEAEGVVQNENSASGTFRLRPITKRDGFVVSGNSVDVMVSEMTVFKDSEGEEITKADFFLGIQSQSPGNSNVRVEGTLTGNTISAREAVLL